MDSRLNEVGFGQGEGRTARETRQRCPWEANAFHADPVRHPLPGGEVPLGRVLVVTRNSLIRIVLYRLPGIPLAERRRCFSSVRNYGLNEVHVLPRKSAGSLQFNVPLIKGWGPGQGGAGQGYVKVVPTAGIGRRGEFAGGGDVPPTTCGHTLAQLPRQGL